MADKNGGRFFWGLLAGGTAGFLLARYLSTEAGRQQFDALCNRTVELTGDPEHLRQRASAAASTVRSAVSEAIQEGIDAARQRREELAARATRLSSSPEPGINAGAEPGRNARADA